ncbi:ABC transporter permease [Aquimarina brevivitae]|uniref:Lipoprotein-releasing system permease protein n=1 Tax=Aquimarina brevivitae TaxID=323412 RepID=A0A4Q7NZY8_9FLAO|nr:FtsX-like permease family protein [Aquimarina brevivitae]RZS93076.1 lipoprotein-releasing system permease protein [Aquimarina brevivitae]
MNFEFFIAKRLIKGKERKSSISAPIIKIAIAAITIGMVMMIITVATGIGLQRKIREKVAAFEGHVIISSFDNNSSVETLVPISKAQDFYPEFKSVKGIRHIQGVATKAGLIRTEEDFEGVVVKGVGADYQWGDFGDYVIEGRLPNFSDDLNPEIIISDYISKRLQLGVGDKAITFFLKKNSNPKSRPNTRAFEIVGVYNSGMQEFDRSFVIADIRHIQLMNKWEENEVGRFEVLLEDFDKIEKKGNEIYKKLPSTLDAQTIAQKYGTIFEWLKLFDLNIIGIIGIIILVAGINMITALLVLILERVSLIGILKALGSSDWSIRKVFLYNASYLILVGLLLGNVLGIGLLYVQQHYGIITLNPDTYYVDKAPVYISTGYIILLNLGTMLLCMLMLLIPSFIVSKISPVKAIRFQ